MHAHTFTARTKIIVVLANSWFTTVA